MNQLEGRRILVTGAGSGIGKAISLMLAARGAEVWLADLNADAARTAAAEAAAAGGKAHGLEVDVTRAASLAAAADEVFAAAGRLDVLVANAGVSTMNHFLDVTEEEWDFNFSVNARGTFLTVQTFAKRMIAQGPIAGSEVRGKIVTTASMASRQAAPLLVPYSASKFAVVGLAQAAAKELAEHKVTVNAVNPGFVKTSMQEREIVWEAKLRGISADEVVADYLRLTPLGRIQTPEDVAKIVAFLAGPDSDFMTGEVVEVNGGAWIS
ncbi:MAG: SDR family oxidoreductase [Trueperaceae bacterium]|nr:SDR family oxidoreductase [Trueperaceae bacterium]MCC6311798.1 SDR family oxidoreductase [Trueperaceae bacterium]MCO5175181.1 SDR family oxidoreductase [Trueperaceae bacterium]MCW5818849.1 SDR family oxidoreductase [Trueperaceae bacterium]